MNASARMLDLGGPLTVVKAGRPELAEVEAAFRTIISLDRRRCRA